MTLAPMPADVLAKWIGQHMLQHASAEVGHDEHDHGHDGDDHHHDHDHGEAPILTVMPPVLTAMGCFVLFLQADRLYQLLYPIVGGG